MRLFLLFVLMLTPLALALDWNEQERTVIKSLGPWPVAWSGDPSNRFSQIPDAIELGKQLFFDRRLSANDVLACADCHRPDTSFAEGVALNRGLRLLERHTPSLLNVRLQTWFGWGGEHDSLWSQSIRPILNPSEMKANISVVRNELLKDERFSTRFNALTQTQLESLSDDQLLVYLGKFLAAYQETLVSEASRFDQFRDALINNDRTGQTVLTEQEQRGLKLFISQGRCVLCHGGPNLSFGEFADIGVSFFTESGVDKGRYAGIETLKKDRFNLLSSYNDDPTKMTASRTQHVHQQHRNWGEFKVPSLRNVSNTAPYMHNGSIATLDDVIDFYSELDEERLHSDGEKILRPLHLNDDEKAALKALLLLL